MFPSQMFTCQLNTHHISAMKQPKGAVESAKSAGGRITEIKAATPNGSWIDWLRDLLYVFERHSQAYLAVVHVKPVPLRWLTIKTVRKYIDTKEHPQVSQVTLRGLL